VQFRLVYVIPTIYITFSKGLLALCVLPFCPAICLPDSNKHSVFSVFRPDQTPPACHWPTIHNIYTLTVILVCPRAGGTSRSLGIRTWPKLCRYWTHQTASQSMSYTVRFPGSCISMSSPWYPLSGSRLKQQHGHQLWSFCCLSRLSVWQGTAFTRRCYDVRSPG